MLDRLIVNDPDTIVTNWFFTEIGGYSVFHETWTWEAVQGCSLVFFTRRIEELDDEALTEVCAKFPYFDRTSSFTIRRERFLTYVNFNFSF